MPQFFRGRPDGGARRDLDQELEILEQQAQTASAGYETQFLNRAGNLCVEAGQPSRALGYFGRTINAYLESGRFSAAEVLCRRVLRIAPDAVRARCTLAWLSLGNGYGTDTERELEEYVRAARRAGKEDLATKQLLLMARAAPSTELREKVAEYLVQLDSTEEADAVYALVLKERNGLLPKRVSDEGELWAKLLRAALMSPQELSEQQSTFLPEEDAGDLALPALLRNE
jgi:hypothetical protein